MSGNNCTLGASASVSNSFAGGVNVFANNNGCFLWGGNFGAAPGVLSSTADNQGIFRTAGGFTIFSNAAGTLGVTLAANATAFAAVCDRKLKEDISVLDYAGMIEKMDEIDIYSFSYIHDEKKLKHRGPMAQDWSRMFPSEVYPETLIDTMDLHAISLCLYKALIAKQRKLERDFNDLKKSLAGAKDFDEFKRSLRL